MRKKVLLLFLLFATQVFSQNYHDTQGKLEIGNSGQATFTVPVAMPPSLKGVGPVINLTYASGQSGGIAGQGWSISSISAISRISTRIDIDGNVDGVDFDANDKLALDGQRLIIKTGTYWQSSSTYQTEVQSNTKIELQGSGNTAYFIVTSPDGSRSWYGNYGGTNATDLTAYYITRFEDTDGNYITYSYTKPFSASLCINEIKFSANVNGLAPLNSIKFNYVAAQRHEFAYIKNVRHEKKALLDNIEVRTNQQLFRKYKLTHTVDPQLGYQRVSQVQEFNGALEAANPIVFHYDTSTTQVAGSERNVHYGVDLNFSDVRLSGDFDGDGGLDFLTNSHLYLKNFSNRVPAPVAIPTTARNINHKFVATVTLNDKLKLKQSLIAPIQRADELEFKYFGLNGANSQIIEEFSKKFQIGNSVYCYMECESPGYNSNPPCASPIANNSNKYIDGDFNGDGITDVIVLMYNQTQRHYNDPRHNFEMPDPSTPDPIGGGEGGGPVVNPPGTPSNICNMSTTSTSELPDRQYLISLGTGTQQSFGSGGLAGLSAIPVHRMNSKTFVADFDGDGKSDLLIVDNNKNYKVYTFNQSNQSTAVTTELLGNGTLENYSTTKQLLLGDFNGDGKTDMMMPDTDGGENHDKWHIYYSNPNPAKGDFFTRETHHITEYWPEHEYKTQVHIKRYYCMDTNNDGKSDLVVVWMKKYKPEWTINDHDTQWHITTFANNIGNTNVVNKFTLDYQSSSNHDSDSPVVPTPIVSTYKNNGLYNDLIMVRNHYNQATFVQFTKDVAKDNLVRKITSSNGGIVDEIDYLPMEPLDRSASLGNFYSYENTLNYPFVEINALPSSYLVSKIRNTSGGWQKEQEFNYQGLVVHMHGLGMIGFKKTARSSWFQNREADVIWSVTETEPLLRGAIGRTYTQLVSGGGFHFTNATVPHQIIGSTVNSYEQETSNSIYSLLRETEVTTDYLSNTKKYTTFFYDPHYFLPTQTVSENYLGNTLQGKSTTISSFENNVGGTGSSYYIGRPTKISSKVEAYGDTKESSEEFFYQANRLVKTKKKGNTTDSKFLIEEFEYGSYGNVSKKILSSEGYTHSIPARSTEYTYDPTGRFVKTVKDVEGMVSTSNSYHPLYGIVTSATDALGRTITSEYDNWGKTKKETNYLGKSIIYTYSRGGGEFVVSKTGDDGSFSASYLDGLGRVKRTAKKQLDGTIRKQSMVYDFLGRNYSSSEPYTGSEPDQWTTDLYDSYGRTVAKIDPTGLRTNIIYDGLTVTATNTHKTTSSTSNANGHKVSSTDHGGTVQFSYFADGNIKETNYEGTQITFQYDEWGKKTQMVDPSAGTYSYTYYSTGEPKTETTPNGTVTYNLDAKGKLIEKTIVGPKTNQSVSYYYHPQTKLLTYEFFGDALDQYSFSEVTYTYDNWKRLSATDEHNAWFGVNTQITYDDYGRMATESISTDHYDTGKIVSHTTRNTYKNGYSWQILNATDNNVLWQANNVNNRGQLTSAQLGNGVILSNSYDAFGLPTQTKYDRTGSGTGNLLTMNTVFDTQRGNLLSRTNNLFNWTEQLTYDSLDRLTSYKDFHGNTVNQTYDATGRITENPVGQYSYDNTKKYQNTSIALKQEPFSHYVGREGIYSNGMEEDGWILNAYSSYDTSKKHYGKKSLKVNNRTNDEVVVHSETWTKIDNTEPTSYTYSGWVYSEGPSTQLFLFMKSENETGYFTLVDDVFSTATGNWTYVEKTVMVPAHIKSLNLRVDNNSYGVVWFDDLSIRKTSDINPLRQLNISYDALKNPISIEETGIDKITFQYSSPGNRNAMFYGGFDNDPYSKAYRKHYSSDGQVEIKFNAVTNKVEFTLFIGGDGYSAPLLLRSDGDTSQYLYLHRDYQGSIVAISDQSATIVEKRLFDAWGNVIKVQDGQGNNLAGLTVLDRGYTGHEHLQSVGLIHMNGRLYDGKLHRFLQPDNFVQDITNTQNYNRYGYVLNNPFKYTDPSGELISLGLAIGIGAAISALTYTITALVADVPFSAGGFAKSVIFGAASGAISFGIGEAFTNVCQFGLKLTYSAIAHGASQGVITGIQGGNFWSSFASGVASSAVSSAFGGGYINKTDSNWGGIGGAFGKTDIGVLAFGTVSGGAGAALTGGNFWQGAATGLVVSGLNHVMHKYVQQQDPLKKHSDRVKHTLEEWEAKYKDMSWIEIATEAGWKDGQPLGPDKDWRYIKAPDGNVMDMRHVVVVGYGYGESSGNIIEHIQNLRESTRGSAFDPQDYYSNKIGAYFYQTRNMGSWSTVSFAYDFKRFIDVHYRTLFGPVN